MKYLGHVVSTSMTETRSFLGLVGYYRRFNLALRLMKLTEKGVKFDWDVGCERAFLELKTLLLLA